MTDHKALIAEAERLVYEEWIERDGGVVDRAHIIEELIEALEIATRRRAVVEAQALEQAAKLARAYRSHPRALDTADHIASILEERAVEIREGRQ